MAKDFKISRTQGLCIRCNQTLEPGDEIYALVRAEQDELLREDYHVRCWDLLHNASANAEPRIPHETSGEEDTVWAMKDTAVRKPQDDPDVLGVWKTRIAQPEEKKKLLVDNALLVNFFERLEGHDEPSRVKFRYVLTLILMRKRLLNYEGITTSDGVDIWKMRLRGTNLFYSVIDPKLDEEQVSEVSASLGEIMEGDFE